MNNDFPVVPLAELLIPISRQENIVPEKEYHILGAHWYAKGLYIKDVKTGTAIQADKIYRVETGDFVYNRLFAWKGSFAIALEENNNCYVSNEFPCFEVNHARVNSNYLWHYFSRATAWDDALGLSSGSTPTSRNRLKEAKLLNMEIPLPSLEEQQRIVARIEELADRIEEARGLRREAVEEAKVLFETSVGSIFENLNVVEHKSLRSLASKIGSGSTPTGGRSSYPSTGIPFIRSQNVRMRYFQREDIAFIDQATHIAMQGTHVKPNDVLLNITGASIGRVACFPPELAEANVNQHVAIIRPWGLLTPRFLMYWLSQPAIQRVINEEQKGATRQGFTKAQIEAFEIPLPSFTEQQRIVNYLDDLESKVNALNQLQSGTSAELDALLPSILDKAFKGEL